MFSAIITNIYIHFRQLLKLTLCLSRFCALLSVSFKVCFQMMLFKNGQAGGPGDLELHVGAEDLATRKTVLSSCSSLSYALVILLC